MKPIALVIAFIMLLIMVIYCNREALRNDAQQATAPHLKIMKDSREFLPNEARMCDLMY